MTPAVNLVKKKKISHHLHSYEACPGSDSYGEEAAEALGVMPARVFKTLVVEWNEGKRKLGVAIVPVSAMLDLKHYAKALGVKGAAMAQPADAQRTTGYVVGGISPLGQKQRLPTVVDQTLTSFETIFVSAGKRGLQVELSPFDLIALTQAVVAAIAR